MLYKTGISLLSLLQPIQCIFLFSNPTTSWNYVPVDDNVTTRLVANTNL